ncbi:CUE domain-containing protein 1 isoform X1 [Dermacentor andersoni]|uniref:CUE domain-containing protein 1 isoform X1 n=2 Tax=Dermacentor andersoni TaxID=34620 RepID=UPI002155C778|nr:CUE domain-containing protein 1-like isoform X1 [Dermacentor andersoni]
MTSPAEVAPEERLSAPNHSPPRRPPVTQLEFRQAMRDFRSMFPEMEAVVIEAVLRANGGAVDASIDQLLAMATDNDNERLRTELEATENAEAPPHYSPPPAAPPPSYQQATCAPTAAPARTPGTQEEARAWKPPLLGPLPPGFLRISRPHHRPSSSPPPSQAAGELSTAMLQQRMAENVRQQRRLSSGAAEAETQLLEDERMAILLQNQEFMRQLQSNRDFIRTLNQDIQSQEMERSAGLVPDDGRPADATEDEPWGTLPHTEETDAAFRERLKNMGKASRRKFAQLARLFHRTKKCHFRQMLGDAANPSRDNLLLHEDPGSSEEDAEARLHQEQRQAQPTKGCPPLGGDSR